MAVSNESVTYTDGAGTIYDLSTILDEQYKQGLNGRFMPEWQHYFDTYAEQDGGAYRGSRATLSQYTLPLLLVADDVPTLRLKHRQLAQAVNPRRGPGTLTVTADDGAVRTLRCIYESGFEADPATDGNEYEQLVMLQFRATEPFWVDATPQSVSFERVDPVGLSPFPLPMRVGPSSIFNQWTQNNPGDVEAWPVWVVTGPASRFVLANETTGQELSFNLPLSAGRAIEVDTRPGRKTVTYAGIGVDAYAWKTGELWSLVEGDNVLRVEMPDAESTSRVAMEVFPRYLGV